MTNGNIEIVDLASFLVWVGNELNQLAQIVNDWGTDAESYPTIGPFLANILYSLTIILANMGSAFVLGSDEAQGIIDTVTYYFSWQFILDLFNSFSFSNSPDSSIMSNAVINFMNYFLDINTWQLEIGNTVFGYDLPNLLQFSQFVG